MQNASGKFKIFSYFPNIFSFRPQSPSLPGADDRFSTAEKRKPGGQTSAGSEIFAVAVGVQLRKRPPSDGSGSGITGSDMPNNYSIAHSGCYAFSLPRASLTTVPDSRNRAMRLGMTIMPLKVSEMSHSSPRSTVAPTMATKE